MRYVQLEGIRGWSRIGLGTWQFGSREWGYGDAYAGREAGAIVRRALELGVTFFDTAEIYGWGRSERILGAALGADAEQVTVATKVFPILPLAPIVEQRAVASADRLGIRRIGLYQVHQPNPLIGDATTMRGMAALQRVGVVDEVGVSNYSLDRWRQAEQALGRRVLSNQVKYSLVARDADRDLVPYAARNDRLVIAHSPLEEGFLSARYDAAHRPTAGIRGMNPLFLPDNLTRAVPLFETLREIAAGHDVDAAQVALAWALRHPNVVVIPGASSISQLERNVAAADLVLAPDEVAALSAAAERFTPATGRAATVELMRARLARVGSRN